jgi:hypothetical protein
MKQFTIRFTTENISNCEWIFDQIKTGKSSNGISINAIADGDLFQRVDILEQQIDILMDNSYDLQNEEAENFEKLEEKLQNTYKREI